MTEPEVGPNTISPQEREALAAWTADVARERQLAVPALGGGHGARQTGPALDVDVDLGLLVAGDHRDHGRGGGGTGRIAHGRRFSAVSSLRSYAATMSATSR